MLPMSPPSRNAQAGLSRQKVLRSLMRQTGRPPFHGTARKNGKARQFLRRKPANRIGLAFPAPNPERTPPFRLHPTRLRLPSPPPRILFLRRLALRLGLS